MSNINKIKAYIERLYDGEAPKHDQQCEFEDGYFTGIATISKFIDSLPDNDFLDESKIASKELKEAAEEYAYRGIPDEIKQSVKPIADEIIKQFIAGAEWQKKQQ